jgi:hypothetical protein
VEVADIVERWFGGGLVWFFSRATGSFLLLPIAVVVGVFFI